MAREGKIKEGRARARKLLLGSCMNRAAITMHHYEGSVAAIAPKWHARGARNGGLSPGRCRHWQGSRPSWVIGCAVIFVCLILSPFLLGCMECRMNSWRLSFQKVLQMAFCSALAVSWFLVILIAIRPALKQEPFVELIIKAGVRVEAAAGMW